MGQSFSAVNSFSFRFLSPAVVPSESDGLVGEIINDVDCTDGIPDECLAHIFQFLSATDRKMCSLVSRRWFFVDGGSRYRLSLNAKEEIFSYVPSLFTRFDSVTKLALRCHRKSMGMNDEAFVMISIRCRKLERLKLRGCREITDDGMAAFAANCKNLKKLSCGSCAFGTKGINAVLDYCTALEELSIKRLRGIQDGGEQIRPGAAGSSLKSLTLKQLVNGQSFEQLVIGAKKLRTLKIIRCLGDWDKVLEMTGNGNNFLIDVHLERIQVTDIGLAAISKWVNLEILHIVKTPECSNLGLITVAENCKRLRKLHIDGWRTNKIGDEGLIAVAKQCPNLQELVLIGVNATYLSLAAIAANCQDLERLALCGSRTIGDQEIACIAAKCLALKKFCIKGCDISDIAIEALAWGCPNLMKVKVKKCRGVSNDVMDWLQERKASLVMNFDATDHEGFDASLSDGLQESSGLEIPVMGSQVAATASPSISTGRLSFIFSKLGLFASRNLVGCAFSRFSSNEDGSSSNS
ncbi:F-box protein SKIP2-like [Euphorbia lathyris]|uniref:F-box protein SKIP2-like n=1 Tax=Euphorbia lathyris TaxID=212925 RepID=UPI0033144B5B